MKNILILLLSFLAIFQVSAQQERKIIDKEKLSQLKQRFRGNVDLSNQLKQLGLKAEPVVCPANHVDVNTYVEFQQRVDRAVKGQKNARGTQKIQNSTFSVDYFGFPADAEASFQRAVDIWQELLVSDVPIRVAAVWQPLGPNVLGSASPTAWRVNFPGAPKSQTYYPISLAEKISRKNLNSPDDYDLVARFSSDQNWYLGATGTPAVGQFDLTSVVLHELCHGLGFFASYFVEGSQGSYGLFVGDERPAIMDQFFENDREESLLDTALFANPSTQLRNELISENLFFNGTNSVLANENIKPRMYAPTIYDPGSSISHLNDTDFPAGTINSLMTPSAGFREVNNDPGPIVMAMFKDMGYNASALIHDAYGDFSLTPPSLAFAVDMFSDSTIDGGTATLHMREIPARSAQDSDFTIESIVENAVEIPLERVAGSNTFSIDYTFSSDISYVVYWFSGVDGAGNQLLAPAGAPGFGSLYFFVSGFPDEVPPNVFHFPGDIVPANADSLFIDVFVEDDYEGDLQTIEVRYSIDGGPTQVSPLRKYDRSIDPSFLSRGDVIDELFYWNPNPFPELERNQRLRYQIVVVDAAGNEVVVPTTAGGTLQSDPVVNAEYEIVATFIDEGVEEYFTDFEDPNEDFSLLGFEIDTPQGLNTRALRTTTPYQNGLGLYEQASYADPNSQNRVVLDFESNQIALFNKFVTIKPDTAIISWDEIVLVEPGEDGEEFGDSQFWDYVIFEYSADGGSSWDNLEPGYDSGDDADWKQVFIDNIGPANAENYTSNALPSASLFRTRSINLYDYFIPEAAGASILLRWRLFSDQWANGYGWVIDNLAIQTPQPPALSIPENDIAFIIGPNPTRDYLNVKVNALEGAQANLEVLDIKGNVNLREEASIHNKAIDIDLNVSSLTAGTYLLKVASENGSKFKKFVVN